MQTKPDAPTAALPASAQPPGPAADAGRQHYVGGVVGASHFLVHFYGGTSSILLPVVMTAMGFDLFQLGLLSSFNQLAGSGMQVVYGVLSQYYRRPILLGLATITMSVFYGAAGLAQTYAHLLAVRFMAGIGSSAQHPLGAAILASHFRHSIGKAVGINHAIANTGSLVAPLLVVALLSFLDWRAIWIILAVPGLLMGCAYFFFADISGKAAGSRSGRTRTALGSYLACLRNRQVMAVSAIQMVGAAGRGTGINQTFFVPFFMAWLGVDIVAAGLLIVVLQCGGVLGPIGFGWLADRIGQKWAIFTVLFLSTVSTITLLLHSQISAVLVLNLVAYGAVVNSRDALTQSMISDAVPEAHADAAFSLYYFIGFISGPMWTALMGYLVHTAGFAWAFVVVGLTYLNGIALLALVGPKKKSVSRPART
ncbi:MAG: MFS transporter [Chloroflexi bacterium]|nr:MFS transporter [Chloroflexota bacterium]